MRKNDTMKQIIDSHCHIYPEKISWKAVKAVDRFYDGLPRGCEHDGTSESLKAAGEAAGITHFVVQSVATKPEQVASINLFIADAVRKAGGAFTGLGTMHPDSGRIHEELDQLISLGLKGVKLHPDIQQFQADSRKAFTIYELCEEKGLPVLLHTGDYRYDYSNPNRVVPILKAFPRLTLIGAHFGGWSVWDEAARVLPDFPNLLVDTSSSFYWLKKDRAVEIIRAYGAERCMFGTDYPMWGPEEDLAYLDSLALTEEEREWIYWRTCAQLYHLE